MRDDELVQAFEQLTLPGEAFTHGAHVRVGWWYLRQHGFAEALRRFSTALRRFATHHGAAGKYHETITVAYMLLIADRLDAGDRDLSWDDFAARHPELLARPSILSRYYSDAVLQSDRARTGIVLPDRT